MDNVELTFDEEVFEFIVDKSIEFKLGARGLRSITEMIMVDFMYEMPSTNQTKLNITQKIAEEKFNRRGFIQI